LPDSEGGYYAWLSEPKSAGAKDNQRLLGLIKHSSLESTGVLPSQSMMSLCSQTGYRRRPRKSAGKPAVASLKLLKRQFDV